MIQQITPSPRTARTTTVASVTGLGVCPQGFSRVHQQRLWGSDAAAIYRRTTSPVISPVSKLRGPAAMSTHRSAADEIPAARVVAALRADAADDARVPAGGTPATAVQPRTRDARQAIRNAVVVGCMSVAGGSAGCAIGGPVLAIVGIVTFIAAGIMGIAAAVALSALLGHRDPRSPFDRVMLILCVILGRSPGMYLPSAQNGQGISPAADALRAPPCSARADG